LRELLLHVCCAPCAVIPLRELTKKFAVSACFFNPNIHPWKEAQERLKSVRKLMVEENIPLYVEDYPYESFLQSILSLNDHSAPQRCALCYEIRLARTVGLARKIKAAFFSSTLLYSKYQAHELIISNAEKVSKNIPEVEFYYQDFRPDFDEGQSIARSSSFYMQNYCGCIFSNEDRFRKKHDFGNN
jgi:epoxyqueuosine reductase